MDYPEEVQKKIDVLSIYEETKTLARFDIFHLYPNSLCYPNGYYDSRWFTLIGFNTSLKLKRDLGYHDGLDFEENVEVGECRIFADGSTMVKFKHLVKVNLFQAVRVFKADM